MVLSQTLERQRSSNQKIQNGADNQRQCGYRFPINTALRGGAVAIDRDVRWHALSSAGVMRCGERRCGVHVAGSQVAVASGRSGAFMRRYFVCTPALRTGAS